MLPPPVAVGSGASSLASAVENTNFPFEPGTEAIALDLEVQPECAPRRLRSLRTIRSAAALSPAVRAASAPRR